MRKEGEPNKRVEREHSSHCIHKKLSRFNASDVRLPGGKEDTPPFLWILILLR